MRSPGGLLEELCRHKKALALLSSLTIGLFLYSEILQFKYHVHPHYRLPGSQNYDPNFLVDTPGCKLRAMDPFDASTPVSKFFHPYPIRQCRSPLVKLVNGSFLVLNEAFKGSSKRNRKYKGVTCCWREITRNTQSLDKYDEDADYSVKTNSTCNPIPSGSEGTVPPPGTQYLKVECLNERGTNIWKDFFALVPSPKTLSSRTANKTRFWEGNKMPPPPNVVVIGIDSISRLHMIRSLPMTNGFLNSNGFLEMRGYTKVGDNTFPNLMAALGGMTADETVTKCWATKATAMDFCPLIWKNFSALNYVTALVEDSPGLASFNYAKTGFVNPPTDYYIRPLMAAEHQAAKHRRRFGSSNDCLGGGLTPTRVLLRYVRDFVKEVNGLAPFFLFSWFNSVAHDEFNGLKPYDAEFRSLLDNLVSSVGQNSLILFISDHGYRFGPFRETFLGFYEESLPFFFLRVPPTLTRTHPDWNDALLTNSARLTTPHDLYATFAQILGVASPSAVLPDPTLHLHGTSLFEVASLQRNCENSSIPSKYCMCGVSKTLFESSSLTFELGNLLVHTINEELTLANLTETTCLPLNYSSFLYGREVGVGEVWNGHGKLEPYRDLLLAVETTPWEGRFEGRIRLTPGTDNESGTRSSDRKQILGAVGRINSYAGKSDCTTHPKMKNYCVCASLWREEVKKREAKKKKD